MIILPTFRGCLASMTFSPSQIPGLGLWLDASAITGLGDGDAISTWNDLSGAGRNATGSGAARPVYKTNIVNSKPVVRFDGVDDVMSLAALSLTNNVPGLTIIAVVKFRSVPAAQKGILFFTTGAGVTRARLDGGYSAGKWGAGGRRLDADSFQSVASSTSIVSSGFSIVEGVFDYANSDLFQYINGALDGSSTSFQTPGNTSATNSTAATIGALGAADFADIDAAEILIWPSTLSSGDRALVRAYLAAKYAISAA